MDRNNGLGLGSDAASTSRGSMVKYGVTSTKTGLAPTALMAPTVATKVFAAVITSSPVPIPKARIARISESVPEPTPMA